MHTLTPEPTASRSMSAAADAVVLDETASCELEQAEKVVMNARAPTAIEAVLTAICMGISSLVSGQESLGYKLPSGSKGTAHASSGLRGAFSGLRAGLSDGFGSVTGADTRIEGVTSWQHRKAQAVRPRSCGRPPTSSAAHSPHRCNPLTSIHSGFRRVSFGLQVSRLDGMTLPLDSAMRTLPCRFGVAFPESGGRGRVSCLD